MSDKFKTKNPSQETLNNDIQHQTASSNSPSAYRKHTHIVGTELCKSFSSLMPGEMDPSKDIFKEVKSTIGIRPHSTPTTLKWLRENYEDGEGVCIPRNLIYQHYVDFCRGAMLRPVNAASFGKIIRQEFPSLTTRRLGTRGQSRYHYYGIAIKEGSKYYDINYSRLGNTGTYDLKRESSGGSFSSQYGKMRVTRLMPTRGGILSFFRDSRPAIEPRGTMAAMLQSFPSLEDFNFPLVQIQEKQTQSFLSMYKTHCQRVLDCTIRTSYHEIPGMMVHFWQSIPTPFKELLSSNYIVNLVGLCNCVLFRALNEVLIPSLFRKITSFQCQTIKKISKDLLIWVQNATSTLPLNLRTLKINQTKQFCRLLRRQVSLNQLYETAKVLLKSEDINQQMLCDWKQLDLLSTSQHAAAAMGLEGNLKMITAINSFAGEFERLLSTKSSLDTVTDWLESLIERCLRRIDTNEFIRSSHSFLLGWTAFATSIIREMTMIAAQSFGSFHLLHLLFDDCLLFVMDVIHLELLGIDLAKNLINDKPTSLVDVCFTDLEDEQMLPNINFVLTGCTDTFYTSAGQIADAEFTSENPVSNSRSTDVVSACNTAINLDASSTNLQVSEVTQSPSFFKSPPHLSSGSLPNLHPYLQPSCALPSNNYNSFASHDMSCSCYASQEVKNTLGKSHTCNIYCTQTYLNSSHIDSDVTTSQGINRSFYRNHQHFSSYSSVGDGLMMPSGVEDYHSYPQSY